jgi:uncharacterized protein (TIGR02271 family)
MTDMRSSASGSGSSSRSFGTRAVTAMFDSRSDAEDAVEELVEAGFAREDIRLVPGYERDSDIETSGGMRSSGTSSYTGAGSDTSYRGPEDNRGFWESLSDFFFPDEDRYSYAEGLRRGGYLVTVNTTEANHDQAVDILDDEGTIDLDEREDQWRAQGWGGYGGSSDTGAGSMSSTSTTTPGVGYTGVGATGAGAAGTSGGMGTSGVPETGGSGLGSTQRERSGMDQSGDWATSRGADREGEQVIPLAEEQLNVGKREVGGGRVRVRSYVVERPVEEQVALRREHVDVQRRAVDRAVGTGDDAFRERTIEMDERSEQPVVSKDARIREEVVVRKDVGTEQHKVSDTVRRTEVEVDDQRSSKDDATRRRS